MLINLLHPGGGFLLNGAHSNPTIILDTLVVLLGCRADYGTPWAPEHLSDVTRSRSHKPKVASGWIGEEFWEREAHGLWDPHSLWRTQCGPKVSDSSAAMLPHPCLRISASTDFSICNPGMGPSQRAHCTPKIHSFPKIKNIPWSPCEFSVMHWGAAVHSLETGFWHFNIQANVFSKVRSVLLSSLIKHLNHYPLMNIWVALTRFT